MTSRKGKVTKNEHARRMQNNSRDAVPNLRRRDVELAVVGDEEWHVVGAVHVDDLQQCVRTVDLGGGGEGSDAL